MTALLALSMRCSWLADVISLTFDMAVMGLLEVAVMGNVPSWLDLEWCEVG